ncbi:Lysosome-associated membrane glycoprotein 1 [Bulinus truncatus]|nr:Lysosome-associated membrane glycoprotein 1 [Bulinus truncatus]
MKLFILAVLFVVAQAVRFEVKEKNVTCLLLDIEGTLNITAVKGKETVSASFNFINATKDKLSNCSVILLNLENKTEVWFQFKDSANQSSVIPVVNFNSKAALQLNESDFVVAEAEPLNFPLDKSFVCKASVGYSFKPAGKFNYSYTISASISNFQIQSGNIKNDSFSPGEECDQDKTSTAATTTPATTPATTTLAPTEDIFSCKVGNITRFLFKANLSLAITYEAKEGNGTKNTTAYIDVPLFPKNNNTFCDKPLEEKLQIIFLDDWTLEYVFNREKNTSSDFYVSHITLNYTTGSLTNPANIERLFVNYTASDNTFLKSSGSTYYVCKANSTVDLSKSVKLFTTQLYYKAFNDKGDIQFTGDATECSADEETSSVVPIAVGAALAGLVVIVLIAYLIGRRRSRKAGYESV